MGANTDLDFFSWAQQNPQPLQWFQQLMSIPREGDWLDVVPTISEGKSDVVLVDVGGGMGQQCARLAARFPELENRIVLQDRPETIKIAPSIKGVKAMAHDFFTPQVVIGKLPVNDSNFALTKTIQAQIFITFALFFMIGRTAKQFKFSRIWFLQWLLDPKFLSMIWSFPTLGCTGGLHAWIYTCTPSMAQWSVMRNSGILFLARLAYKF